MLEKIKVGISSCLLGEPVRYDGGHKLDKYLVETLGEYVEYVPVCPEAECGLGVPREPMRLVGDPLSPRLVTIRTGRDHTDRMIRWARKRVVQLEREDLCGFIFKSRSPSSGMERVKVYTKDGSPQKKGVGLFAGVFMDHFPLIPAEDEGRLHDPVLRENFIERVFVLKRWRELSWGQGLGRLVAFHTAHKLLILSHSAVHYREMGRLVAAAKSIPRKDLFSRYETMLMQALRLKATGKKNTDVLFHMLGYLKRELSRDEKEEMLEIIEQYRSGHLPLIVPVTLIKHYVRKYDQPYLKQQIYLDPHPISLLLRNHA
jgi:uncharacterized protein YbgA (DUF1722 family)/uncharacterized protein YbbK (DUF523 family)